MIPRSISRSMTTAATLAALSLSTAALAGGGTGLVDFEDAVAWFGPGANDMSMTGLDTFYAGQGMTMSCNETVWVGDGVSQGDAGNFDIEGTEGPGYLALWDTTPGGTMTFTFDRPVNFLIDLLFSGITGEGDVICTMTSWRNGVLVDHEILTQANPFGDPDGIFLFRQFDNADTFQFQLAPNSERVMGFDYIEWEEVGCGVADINGDGFIDFIDISAFLSSYDDGCIVP